MVDLQRHFVGPERVGSADFIEVSGKVRNWNVLVLSRLPGRIDSRGRDHISRERHVRDGIPRLHQGLREIARALERRRNDRRVPVIGFFLPQTRIAGEEERLSRFTGPPNAAPYWLRLERVLRRCVAPGGAHRFAFNAIILKNSNAAP